MDNALDSRINYPASSPGQGHCVVFLGKHLHVTLPTVLACEQAHVGAQARVA